MTEGIRIAFDSLVASAVPDFRSLANQQAVSTGVFEAFDSPRQISATLQELRPNIVVVDPSWLVVASQLGSLIDKSGFSGARRVVAGDSIDDVLKVKAAHKGMFDVVDLRSSTAELLVRFREIHNGTSALNSDVLWRRVPRPKRSADITTVPQDLTDVAILELITIGFRDQDIAEALHYSVQAIKNRIGIMLKRSGSNNRTQLAVQYTDKLLTAQIIEALERPKNPAQNASKM